KGKREHARRADKVDGRRPYDVPSSCAHLRRLPALIGEVEIDAIVVFGDAQMDGMFGAVELRLRLDVIKRRAHARGAGGAPGCCVIPAPQPKPKAGAANGPGFPCPSTARSAKAVPPG